LITSTLPAVRIASTLAVMLALAVVFPAGALAVVAVAALVVAVLA
jgi:hypothetical protein